MRLRFRRRKLKPVVKLLLALVFIILVLAALNYYITPVVNIAVKSKIEALACEAVNSAVIDELNESGMEYKDFVNINRSDDNQVLAISSDSVKINKFKSAVSARAAENLNNSSVESIKIPLGTLLGSNIFSGRGPNISIKVTILGNIKNNLRSEFVSAGINQTKHQIYLDFGAKMAVMLPSYDNYVDISTSVIVAETVIIGTVPEVFASGSYATNNSISDLAQLNE